MQNAGYGHGAASIQNPFDQRDPFVMSNGVAPPPNVQMVAHQYQYQYQEMGMMTPHHHDQQQYHQLHLGSTNPFGDPFVFPSTSTPQQRNHGLI